jgi:hypothetical protein
VPKSLAMLAMRFERTHKRGDGMVQDDIATMQTLRIDRMCCSDDGCQSWPYSSPNYRLFLEIEWALSRRNLH